MDEIHYEMYYEMDETAVRQIVNEINAFVQKELWMDFEVIEYKPGKLTIIGSIDPSWDHNIAIDFEQVFFVSLPIAWKTDTKKTVLTLVEGEEAYRLNVTFQVEIGHHLFRFTPEYYPETFGCFVAAKRISYMIPS